MPIEFRCPVCQRVLRTPDDSAGKKARCPQCSSILSVPDLAQGPTVFESPESSNPVTQASGEPGASFQPTPFSAESQPFASSQPVSPPPTPSNPFGDVDAGSWSPQHPTTSIPEAVNPYSPPSFDAVSVAKTSTDPHPMVYRKVSIDELFERTWSFAKENLVPVLVLGLIFFGLAAGGSMVGAFAQIAAAQSGDRVLAIAGIVFQQIVNAIIQTFAWSGAITAMLTFIRTKRMDYGLMFTGARFIVRLILSYLVFVLVLIPFVVPPVVLAVLSQEDAALVVGIACAVLGMITMFYVGSGLILTPMMIVDRNVGLFESIRLSNQFMKGNRVSVVITGIVVTFAIFLASVMSCCLGFLVQNGFYIMFFCMVYLCVTGYSFPPGSRK